MDIGERLKKARQSLGLSQIEIAEVLGFQSNFLSNIERGAKKPPKKLIELLSSRYKINANWLLTGEGDMVIENANTTKTTPIVKEMKNLIEEVTSQKFSDIESRLTKIENLLKQDRNIFATSPKNEYLYVAEPKAVYAPTAYGEEKKEKIPYVWDIAAGPPITQSDDPGETVSVPSRLIKKGERYYAASIRGGSMAEAGIRDGDMVLIRCVDVPEDGAIQVVRYKDKSTLKRLHKTDKGWELHYEDGSGKVIKGDSADYEVQGEFIAVLPMTANLKDGI